MTRLYSLTEAGRKAWDSQNNRVPLDSRRVLGLIKPETDPRDLRARLGWSEDALDELLKELERGGLVKSIGMSASPEAPDLDFTDSLKVADIQAALRARNQK
jgi:DNA-binding MarR family transcriptional regulator